MNNEDLIGTWIRRFLLEHMIGEVNLARNTQTSYRDTLALLLPFAAKQAGTTIDRLTVEHLSAETTKLFLAYLEDERRCSIATRNQRLAAIHALVRFISSRCPELVAWATQVLMIRFKKGPKGTVAYLDKPEIEAMLEAPDRRRPQGFRDQTLLLFLYNSGARADEAARLTVADLDLGRSPSVRILGKGRKLRLCPLWASTARELNLLVEGRTPADRVFLNRRGQALTRFGIYALVKRCAIRAGGRVPSLRAKHISPHTIRHTTAVHLLRSGVDINTIRAWLGHVSLDTTNIYAEVDLEMKAKALALCEVPDSARPPWRNQPSLMAFLKRL
jgi:site-specific recombinase XerD